MQLRETGIAKTKETGKEEEITESTFSFPMRNSRAFLPLLIKSRETTGNESASVTVRLSTKFEVVQGEAHTGSSSDKKSNYEKRSWDQNSAENMYKLFK